MNRTYLLVLLLGASLFAPAQTVVPPYNPDANGDSAIGAPDLLGLLPLFGTYFTPAEVMVDGQTLTEYIDALEAAAANATSDTVAIPMMPGTAPGQMLYWDGTDWTLVPVGQPGDALLLDGTVPTWTSSVVPVSGEVGCTDEAACNFDAEATVNYAALCLYADDCGVCDGPGAIYACGCAGLPDSDCDCDGNQLDALNVCGGTCLSDADGDGICDDEGNDACIGTLDACGICNGPGAIYDCGCTGIAPDVCDCAGTPDVDQDGICDNVDPCVGLEDSDGDGICDDVDDCEGAYDDCGVCNGPGPIYDCGCNDIPEGDCDCAGNLPDSEGNCQDFASDTDGDGLYDTLLEPCLNQTTYVHFGVEYELVVVGDRCWFRNNVRHVQYANGDSIDWLQETLEWNNASAGAYSFYGGDETTVDTYGLMYNWLTSVDQRGVCPTGWEVASESDWTTLANAFGGPSVAGGALKAAGTLLWEAPNAGGTNSSGFTAVPSGERGYGSAGDVDRGTRAFFWTKTQSGSGARSVRLSHDDAAMSISTIGASRGQSLRCVRKPASFGCTDLNFLEYDSQANVDDGSCATPSIPGCTDAGFAEYNPQANVNDGSCATLVGCSDSTSVDFHGHGYGVVAIGSQCWFSENLRSAQYRTGESILNIQDPVEWGSANNGSIAGYAVYDNSAANADVYGHLYNFYAVEDARGLCPAGWHVPTDDDWKVLELFLGMPASEVNSAGWRGGAQNVGNQLKATNGWYNNGNGTDDFGFSALPGGYRNDYNGYFYNAANNGFWWSSSPSGGNAWFRRLGFSYPDILRNDYDPRNGFSVRCLRDAD